MTYFTEKKLKSQEGKTVVVTGANTGIGYEIARAMSAKGARVILACRSQDKAADAIAGIKKANGSVDLEAVALDLGSLKSVKSCAKQLNKESQIDVLINNAGIMSPPFSLTEDGYESQFAVNHLGHFALTCLLLDKIEEADSGRVVTTSSLMHRTGKILFDDINADKSYNANRRYAMSKLANLVFAKELDRRLKSAGHKTISVACHPGIADTELSRFFPGIFKLMSPVYKLALNSAASGAWPSLLAATDPAAMGGEYYGPSRRFETAGPARRASASVQSRNEAIGTKLWDVSVEMTGVDAGL